MGFILNMKRKPFLIKGTVVICLLIIFIDLVVKFFREDDVETKQGRCAEVELALNHTKNIAVVMSRHGDRVYQAPLPLNPSRVLVNHPKKCQGGVKMLFAVMSRAGDRKNRDLIRSTWGQDSVVSGVGAAVVFFIGKVPFEKSQAQIEAEVKEHADIVQFNFIDTYQNLALKSVSMLRWFEEHCGGVAWYVKTDVDAFWNILELKVLLESQNRKLFLQKYERLCNDINIKSQSLLDNHTELTIVSRKTEDNKITDVGLKIQGRNASKVTPKQSNKEGTDEDVQIICPKTDGSTVCRKPDQDGCEARYVVLKEEYPFGSYPTHCHGYSYIIKNDVVTKILNEDYSRAMMGVQRFRMEDVYITGMIVDDMQPRYLDISSQTVSNPRSLSLVIDRPVLLIHNVQRHLKGAAKDVWRNMMDIDLARKAKGIV